jgi:hypothetical protein
MTTFVVGKENPRKGNFTPLKEKKTQISEPLPEYK